VHAEKKITQKHVIYYAPIMKHAPLT